MNPSRPAVRALALVVALSLAALGVASCSNDDDNPTQPQTAAESFDSGTLNTNQEYTRVFAAAGSYAYRCKFHGGMTGTVVVDAAGADSAHVDMKDNFFDPASVTIKPGGKVEWENKGVNAHSATRP